MDVVVGGVMLGIGLAVVMSLASRALSRQTDGEKRMAAAWLADELLNMVLMEGPDVYHQKHDTSGTFRAPFDDFSFEVDIDEQGLGLPYEVTAVVAWPARRPVSQIAVQTFIALRTGGDEVPREPLEPLDREARYFDDEMAEEEDR
ncbi:MAG: type IV pilus modification PilV family protein [Planctomycetota bacterium]|jgi:hypothetical protein